MENDVLSFSDFIKPDETFEFIKNSLKEIDNSLHKVMGSAKIFAEILDEDVRAGGKSLNEAAEVVDWLRKSYVALAKTQTEAGKIGIALNEIVKQEGKIQGAEAKQIVNAAGSYYQLAAALEEAETKYKMLSEDERKWSAAGAELLERIKTLRAQIGEFNREIGNIGLVTTEDKLNAQIVNLQKEGQVMADLRQRIADLKAAQKGLAEGKFFSDEGIAQADRLRMYFSMLQSELKSGQISQEEYDKNIKLIVNDTLKLVAAEKQLGKSYKLQGVAEGAAPEAGVRITRDSSGALQNVEVAKMELLTYDQLNAVYKLITETLHNYNTEQLKTDETAKNLIATNEQAVKLLNDMDNKTGKTARQWDGLRMQVTQVVREIPSLAISWNTFFLAISNNLPYLADEIKKANDNIKDLKKKGEEFVPLGKQIASAIFSWNTALVLVAAAFAIWGEDIIKWVKSVFVAEKALTDFGKAMENINKQAKKHNADYAKQATLLKSLSSIWQELTTQEERIKFVEQYQDKFKELGVSIKDVNDAENLFVEHTADMLKALKLRAQQAAAQKQIEEEYKNVIDKEFDIEDYRNQIERYRKTVESLRQRLADPDLDMNVANSLAKQLGYYEDQINKKTRLIEKKTKDIAAATQTIETYQKVYERLLKGERDVFNEAGIKAAEEAERQKDLTDRLNQEQLNALKRRNKLEESLMADGYVKNVKKIKDGYEEERKEIQKQMDSIKSLLKKEWGLVIDTSNLDNIDPTAKAFVELFTELGKQIKLVNDAESADLGKEWLAEQTRRAQAAKDAVQLQLEAVKAGSEEEYRLKMELIWKEYDEEIAANKEKEQTKQQDSLAIYEKYLKKETDLRNAHDKELRDRRIQQLELEMSGMVYGRDASTRAEEKIGLQREQALADIEQSGLSAEEQEEKRLATEQHYNRLILQERVKLANQLVSVEKNEVDIETGLARKLSTEKLQLLLKQNELAEQTELNNAWLAASTLEEYNDMAVRIIRKYTQLGNFIKGEFAVNVLDDQQALAEAVFNIVEHTEQQITKFELEQEKQRWEEQIKLAKAGMLDWSKAQIAAAEATVEGINNKLKKLEGISGVIDRIAEHGLLGIFDMTDAQYDAWENYADFIVDQIDKVIDAYIQLAQAAVDAQQQQVDAARTVYEAELEARANGYANNVETAKKELQLQKETLREKQRRLAEAERVQRIADIASTSSSLIVAIAQLYKAYAGIPYVGLIIAAAAVTGLIGMFAASVASAKASVAQNYGHGGYEVLEGGSHASGNDIDLGVNNRHNRRMRAEGGEGMAIFSRRATKRYREVLPDLVDSINKGKFEEQYANTLVLPEEMRLGIGKERYVNLNKIEHSLDQLTEQGAEQYSVMPDGSVIIKKGNVTRIIKR